MPKLIPGNIFRDERGTVSYCNDFFMNEVKRMYILEPSSTKIIRAWQGHQIEQKWFFCLAGSFEIKLVQVYDFRNPSENAPVFNFFLNAEVPQVLYIPCGFASGIKAAETASKLIVYSDFSLDESMKDDFRFALNTWNAWEV